MPNQPEKLYNIHQILNEFEKHFPYKRKKIKITSVSDTCIYVKIIYKQNVTLDESNTHENWNDGFDLELIKKGNKDHTYSTCSIMIRLWINRTEHKNVTPPENWKLILFKDSIYINPLVMPDYNMAQEFYKARNEFTSCLADLMFGQWKIKLSTRQIKMARTKFLKQYKRDTERMNQLIDMSVACKNKLSELDTAIRTIEADMIAARFLYLGPYGSGVSQYDKKYKENTQSLAVYNPDFDLYNTK